MLSITYDLGQGEQTMGREVFSNGFGSAGIYGALADRLKGAAKAKPPAEKTRAISFYESVKVQISKEIEKANVELLQRGLPIIERVFVPSRLGKFSLSFGTSLLCHVDLTETKGRITKVLIGPPNNLEIARKEYVLNHGAVDVATGHDPERIAVEIVSCLMKGFGRVRFNAEFNLMPEPGGMSAPSIAAAWKHEPGCLACPGPGSAQRACGKADRRHTGYGRPSDR